MRLAPLFLTNRVQKDCDENDCSLHKLYAERGHVQEVEPVSQHADGQNPETCSDHVSFPAKQRSATDNNGRNNVQLKTRGGWHRGAQPPGQNQPGKTTDCWFP